MPMHCFIVSALLISLFCGGIPAVHAGTLQEDYQALVQQRQVLENQRREYESRLQTLAGQVKSLTIVFFQCMTHKDKAYWEEKVARSKMIRNELETERKEIAQLRREINPVRQELEERRRAIEERHTRKGPGTPYETEFREYMEALRTEYFGTLTGELFAGYDTYAKEMTDYIEFLKTAIAPCMNRKQG